MIDYPLITARAAERIARQRDVQGIFSTVTKTWPDCSIFGLTMRSSQSVQQSGERFDG